MDRASRRAVVKGTAWAAPVAVLATAAPAYASSGGCVPGQAVFSPGGHQVQLASFVPSSVTATFEFSFSGYPAGVPLPTAEGTVVQVVNPPPPPAQYLYLYHLEDATPGATVTMTMTLSDFVSNLSLTVYGIDRRVDIDIDWRDEVVVDTPGYTIPARGAAIVGAGTSADPIRRGSSAPVEDFLSNFATVSWVGPILQVQLSYRAGGSTVKEVTGQYVGVTDVGFTC